jgi:hypothetical protein
MKSKINLVFLFIILSGIQSINAQDYTATKKFGQDQLAIREVRKNAITGNIGWNGLTGIGVTYHNYLLKQLGLDVGIGLSSTGVKFGGRFSYLFSEKNFSPFVSAGFMYGNGINTEIDYDMDGDKFSCLIESSPFAQIGGGIEYMSNKGFLINANIGYAILLKESNYEITRGTPNNNNVRALDAAFGSGIVIEFSIGYAF